MSGSTSTAEAPLLKDASAVCRWCSRFLPAACGLLAMLLVLASIDVRDDLNWSGEGPGLTFDEGFNVETGVYLVESLRGYGLAALHPASLAEIYGDPVYNPDHPPLGRLVLGIVHAVVMEVHGDELAGQRGYVITYARIGSALLFGLTVAVVAWGAARWYGSIAGPVAAVSLVLLPRVFAHAHLAALETAMGLAYTLAVVGIADRWSTRNALTWREGALAGVLIGLAILTKIQAILLPPILVAWALWNWRLRAFPALIVAGLATFVVFFVGWPWLWLDPVGHLKEYFLRAADRPLVYCYYLGERFADKDVPWHYPWVMFLVTTPLPLLVLLGLGLIGLCESGGPCAAHPPHAYPSPPKAGSRGLVAESLVVNRRRFWLLVLAVVAPLTLFSLPGASVYDGERLFLIAWPPAAVLMGRGAAAVWEFLIGVFKDRRRSVIVGASIGLTLVVIEAATQSRLQPCQLGYYNVLVGWLKGAADRGFEVSYWGDGVTAGFLDNVLDELPQGATLDVTPVLHPLTLEWMRTQQTVARPDVRLRGFDLQHLDDVRYVLAIPRRADTAPYLQLPPANWTVVAENRRLGVPLAILYKITRP